MASTRIYRTMGSPTNDKIWTISGWFKFSSNDGHILFASDANNNTSWTQFRFSSNRLQIGAYDTSWLITNRVFRDRNAWYHIVVAKDSTQSTAADRIKVYINGVQETSFATDNRGSTSLNQSWGWNKNGVVNNIGGENASGYGDFLLSHFHNIDGTAYDASAFGETDSTTGEWKIKTSPSVTYGNNGFFWLKDSVATTDHSPNSNTFTIGGTLTKTEDCPDNIFATLNPDDTADGTAFGLANGNTSLMSNGGSGDYGLRSTLGANKGKYYMETKLPNYGGGAGGNSMAIADMSVRLQANMHGGSPRAGTWGIQRYNDSSTNIYTNGSFGSQNTAMWGGFTTSDVICIALDCDNGKIFFGKNGVFKDTSGNTGDPAAGTNPTFSGLDTTKYYGFFTENRANLDNGTAVNFGNGYFGTTAVSSAGTNASNIGIFEYDVPAGFTALSTKGLNSF